MSLQVYGKEANNNVRLKLGGRFACIPCISGHRRCGWPHWIWDCVFGPTLSGPQLYPVVEPLAFQTTPTLGGLT